ncbi:hypothetical protein J3E69DRAFT_179196 [Trichoderma sp. SZMC 28015]
MLEHSRLPTHLHPFSELALCGQCLLFYFLGLAISQSTTIAALCVKRRKLSNCLIYSFSHQCYESDRMYEQWGFTPPSLPLPYTRGSLILNWHAIYSPCSGSFSLRDKTFFCFLPLGGRESCDLRPPCAAGGIGLTILSRPDDEPKALIFLSFFTLLFL